MIGQSLAAQPLHASVSHDVNKEDGCMGDVALS